MTSYLERLGQLGVIVVAAYVVVAIIRVLSAENICLQRGYRDTSISVTLTAYCIKRVNQTDVVVPLAFVRDGQ